MSHLRPRTDFLTVALYSHTADAQGRLQSPQTLDIALGAQPSQWPAHTTDADRHLTPRPDMRPRRIVRKNEVITQTAVCSAVQAHTCGEGLQGQGLQSSAEKALSHQHCQAIVVNQHGRRSRTRSGGSSRAPLARAQQLSLQRGLGPHSEVRKGLLAWAPLPRWVPASWPRPWQLCQPLASAFHATVWAGSASSHRDVSYSSSFLGHLWGRGTGLA